MQSEEILGRYQERARKTWHAGFDDRGLIINARHGCGLPYAEHKVESGREARWVCRCGAEVSHIELYRLADRRK